MGEEKRNLPAKNDAANREIKLHDNGLKAGSLIEQSLASLNKEQAQNLMAKAGEEALIIEVKARKQNLDYAIGKKAIEDHIDTFAMLDKSNGTTRQKVISNIKTGAGDMRIESKSGVQCFVATVAYGDPSHPDVVLLRRFRDEVLVRHTAGRAFIAWYWRTGPRLADFIGCSKHLKFFSKYLLGKLVFGLRKSWHKPSDIH